VAKGILFLAVRFASSAEVDIGAVARDVIARAGYTAEPFDAKTCSIMISLDPVNGRRPGADERALDDHGIAEITAGHSVTLFGYACRHSPGMLPLPIWLAHRLARELAAAREDGALPYLGPDGQTQVSVTFRDRQPARIHGLTVVTAVDGGAPAPAQVRADIMERVIAAAFADEPIKPDADTRILVNPDGRYLVGGPAVHAGLTGRKTAIDTYGDYARHSGAAMSGKDPGRIDRVGAYAARHAARNVVAAGLARECEIQLSYTIGQARPVSVQAETFGTNVVDEEDIVRRVKTAFDFRPAAIVAAFDLRHLPRRTNGPFYERLAAYGQLGRTDMALPWEELDRVDALS
jgi:S-adenosylmethionine synthetase